MKKLFAFVLAAVAASSYFAATPEERAAAKAELLDGVTLIGCEKAVVGPVLNIGEDSFPLFECKHYDGNFGSIAGAAFYGKGRAIYMGHNGFFDPSLYRGDCETFLCNAIKWLSKGKEKELLRIGAWNDGGFASVLEKLGYEGVENVNDPEKFKDYDVITARNFPLEHVKQFVEFVKNGGGLLGAGLGWGFKFYCPDKSLAHDYGDNQVFGPMGLLSGDKGVNWGNDKGFPAIKGDPPIGLNVEDALTLAASGEYPSKETQRLVSKTLSLTIDALPPTARPELQDKFLALTKLPEANKIPTTDAPLGEESVIARIAMITRKNDWQGNPVKLWPADPAAAVYPGAVKEGTPSVTRKVEVDCSVPRWHSTGLFAVAGRAVTIKTSEAVAKLGLSVRIGTTQDDVTTAGWARAPLVTVSFPLDKTELTFSTPFGGLVYIDVPMNNNAIKDNKAEIEIDGAVMSPHFKLGRDTNDKFIKECAETGAPQAEIEGMYFIITTSIGNMKQVTDPEWIASYWDKVMEADRDLAQWKEPRRYPERLCGDVQLTAGLLHDGYPLMYYFNRDGGLDLCLDKEKLQSDGEWGTMHEIGHLHQSRAWTPNGTGEVTVNLFTTYAIETVSGVDCRDNRFASSRKIGAKRVQNWVSKGKKYEEFKSEPFLALEMYMRLRDVYGWEAYKKVFARYLEKHLHPSGEEGCWSTFAKEFSAVTGENLGAVMAAWSLPVSDEALNECKKYKEANPALTKGLARKPYVAPKTEPVSGQYMGVCLVGGKAGMIEMYKTREAIPGGEKDNRWKTDWMLLRRVNPTIMPVLLGKPGASRGTEAEREVDITKPYYIGVYEVTQRQWLNITGDWKGDTFNKPEERDMKPVNRVSYYDARGSVGSGINWPKTGHDVTEKSFLGLLRELTGFRAEFDLPTEAQWEVACHAETDGKWNNGENPKPYSKKLPGTDNGVGCDQILDKLGRYCGNGGTPDGTAIVGSYMPNAWGLYDMHGNVNELCLDWFSNPNECDGCDGVDPKGPADEQKNFQERRVIRGGTWWDPGYGSAEACASWCRNFSGATTVSHGHEAVGLRVCVPAGIAKTASLPSWASQLKPDAVETRTALVNGVGAIDSAGLPGPVYCLSDNAFPIIAARNWDDSSACMCAGSFLGKGRVIFVADDKLDPALGDNAVFDANVRKWLGATGEVKTVSASNVTPEEADKLVEFVQNGGGLFVTGRAWPWWQKAVREKGEAAVSEWPGNKLLEKFGLACGGFCVSRTSFRGFNAKTPCEEGAADAPADYYKRVKFSVPQRAETPEVKFDANGILIHSGESIAFLGDSITRLGNNKDGFIDLVIKGLEVVGVKDVGKLPAGWDGQHSGDMLGRVGGLVANPNVKVMTLSCGVNDVWGFDWSRGVELEEYEKNVRAIYDKAARAGVLVVAMTPTLIQEDVTSEKNRILDQFAEFIREEAKVRGIPLADCRADEIAGLAAFPKDGKRHFTYDGVHPIKEGHRLIAKSILRALGVKESIFPEIEKAWDKE